MKSTNDHATITPNTTCRVAASLNNWMKLIGHGLDRAWIALRTPIRLSERVTHQQEHHIMRRLLLLTIVVVAGCADTSPEPTALKEPTKKMLDQLPARPSHPSPSQPVESVEDKRVREFREKVSVYLDEARAGAKLLTLAPSLSQARKKSEQITDLYTHLPDVPALIPEREIVEKRLKNINGFFAVAEYTVKLQLQAASLESAELIEKTRGNIEKIAGDIKAYCDEVESHVSAPE